jgi:hypothetical protein
VDSTPNGTSELPGLACARLRPNQVVGTGWIAGGVTRSMDTGTHWTTVDNTTQPWGIDISHDDPNVVVFAQYSNSNGPPLGYISIDGGQTYTSIPQPLTLFNNNYGIYCRDRATILAQQSSGIWKLQNNYAYTPARRRALQLVAPIGSEQRRRLGPVDPLERDEHHRRAHRIPRVAVRCVAPPMPAIPASTTGPSRSSRRPRPRYACPIAGSVADLDERTVHDRRAMPRGDAASSISAR